MAPQSGGATSFRSSPTSADLGPAAFSVGADRRRGALGEDGTGGLALSERVDHAVPGHDTSRWDLERPALSERAGSRTPRTDQRLSLPGGPRAEGFAGPRVGDRHLWRDERR